MSADAVLKKLKLVDQDPVLILNAPAEFEPTIEAIKSQVHREASQKYQYVQAFAITLDEVESYAKIMVEHLEGDGMLWCCYPKGSSKKYKCEFNRDTGWAAFGKYDFEGVTQVAIDQDWSALRFRHVDYIKKFTRNWAISKKGGERLQDKS